MLGLPFTSVSSMCNLSFTTGPSSLKACLRRRGAVVRYFPTRLDPLMSQRLLIVSSVSYARLHEFREQRNYLSANNNIHSKFDVDIDPFWVSAELSRVPSPVYHPCILLGSKRERLTLFHRPNPVNGSRDPC
jgi:hypothetical protein